MEPHQLRISKRFLISNSITVSFCAFGVLLLTFFLITSPPSGSDNTPSIWCTFVFLYSFALIFVPSLILSVYAATHTTFGDDGVMKQGLFRRKHIRWDAIVGIEIAPTRFILYSPETSIYISLPVYADPEPIRAFILAHLPADLLASLEQVE